MFATKHADGASPELAAARASAPSRPRCTTGRRRPGRGRGRPRRARARRDRRLRRPPGPRRAGQQRHARRHAAAPRRSTRSIERLVARPATTLKGGHPQHSASHRAHQTTSALHPMIESHGLTKRLGGVATVVSTSASPAPRQLHRLPWPQRCGQDHHHAQVAASCPYPDAGHACRPPACHDRKLLNPGRRVGILLDASAQHVVGAAREAPTLSSAPPTWAPTTSKVPRAAGDSLLFSPNAPHASGSRPYSLGHAPAARRSPTPESPATEVLILDEPAKGPAPRGHALDARVAARLRRPRRHRPLVLAPGLRDEVEAVADQLLIIGNGEIVAASALPRRSPAAPAGPARLGARAPTGSPAGPRAADASLTARAHPDGGFIVEAEPDDVGRAALAGGVALSRLGPSKPPASSSSSST